MTFPSVSTAAQNEIEGHETEVKNPFGSIVFAADHVFPLNVNSSPDALTAPQNEEDGHETELSRSLLIRVALDQVWPL